ncbi:transcriptional regulator [Halosimplex pelagicum]|uniref:Putative HTH-type transcriptional regulatory protein HZS54_04095 n=1 Tax=Halosimplex pelagicum TaxID=869886 RepID=A0A7D5T9W8_9EURY|nr:transcriptional regulator [Halosimplex pelagicum]QLH80869.1 transcriptional regulator [Halosimplex pelagicum]
MSRSALVGNVTAMLEDAGFVVSERCAIRPKSFDIAARRGEEVLLVKILGNIDAFDGHTGAEMRRLGTYLGATPMVIGLRTRDEELKPGVTYFRHGVPVLSPDTAMDLFVEEVPPLIYAAPGGLYVNIDSEVLADAREDRDWSLGRLANELGVSRRTVSKYEDGMDASVEVASQLQELFDEPLTSPVEVLEGAEEVREDEETPEDPEVDPEDEPIVAVLTRVGFDVHPTDRAPFKTVSENERREEEMLTGHSELTKTAEKRARIMSSVGRVTRTRSVYVVERATRKSVEGTAIVEESEMENIQEADELRDIIRERADIEGSSA